jgi:hypothetical protein
MVTASAVCRIAAAAATIARLDDVDLSVSLLGVGVHADLGDLEAGVGFGERGEGAVPPPPVKIAAYGERTSDPDRRSSTW